MKLVKSDIFTACDNFYKSLAAIDFNTTNSARTVRSSIGTTNITWGSKSKLPQVLIDNLSKITKINSAWQTLERDFISYTETTKTFTFKCPYCKKLFNVSLESLLTIPECNCGCNNGYRSRPEIVIARHLLHSGFTFLYEPSYCDNQPDGVNKHKPDFIVTCDLITNFPSWIFGIQYDGPHHFQHTYKGVKTASVHYTDKLHNTYMQEHGYPDLRIAYDKTPNEEVPNCIDNFISESLGTDSENFAYKLKELHDTYKSLTILESNLLKKVIRLLTPIRLLDTNENTYGAYYTATGDKKLITYRFNSSTLNIEYRRNKDGLLVGIPTKTKKVDLENFFINVIYKGVY